MPRRASTLRIRLALVTVALALVAQTANAATCPQSAEKLAFLRATLKQTISADRDWSTKWALGWGGLTALQLAVSPFIKEAGNNRGELYVGAFGSAMGLVPTLLVRPSSLSYEELAARTDTSCETLATTEAALDATVKEEDFRRGWLTRIGGALFSGGLALFLALDFHHWASAGVTFGFGLVATEAMIRTSTDLAIRNLERYHHGDYSLSRSERGFSARPIVLLDRSMAGVGVQFSL